MIDMYLLWYRTMSNIEKYDIKWILNDMKKASNINDLQWYSHWWFQPFWKILISQLGSLFRNIRKVIKAYKSHVPNHQPVLNDIPSGYLT